MDNMFKLHVSRAKGNYNCFRCAAHGSFSHLKQRLKVLRTYGSDIGNEKTSNAAGGRPAATAANHVASPPAPRPTDAEEAAWTANLQQSSSAHEYLSKQRGLTMQTARLFGVGLTRYRFKDSSGPVELECLSFPMHELGEDKQTAKLARMKLRAIESKKHMRLHPVGGNWGVFGLDAIDKGATEVVLTEGEFDAMAVRQATGASVLQTAKPPSSPHPPFREEMPVAVEHWLRGAGKAAVSLPNGASSLPPAILPALERFSVVYLWMDNDAAGAANQVPDVCGRVWRCVATVDHHVMIG